ncbi:putative RTA1 domain protein [Aureobasidium subglaciale]|nr:putative RTA1 domain protein [Aureobasidium subglaciale]
MVACNASIEMDLCTLQTCCFEQGFLDYPPNLGVSVAYLTIFGIFMLAQLGIAIYYRTWAFGFAMFGGLILEIIGYTGRILIRSNPFDMNIFLAYFIPLGLGPAFLTAAIYITLGHVVIVFGEQYSRLKPKTYSLVFVCIDIFSLCIQAVGGALTATADEPVARQNGTDVLIAGLALQAVSLATFILLSADFLRKVKRGNKDERNPDFENFRSKKSFKLFQFALPIAALVIMIRCIYRVVELCQGFGGQLANEEIPFDILEGPMIIIACICLTVFHPGFVFRGGYWEASSWVIRTSKKGGIHIKASPEAALVTEKIESLSPMSSDSEEPFAARPAFSSQE